ncbi:unnamed protein product [Cuscuta campestris]|uniref:Uncharacterized protein n=1 Tax=Cuscuta campestris TaxID=132261 RepID=A0A484MQV0_9ASTE|nr:unnamed protein product [Cuscuta campestris]
MNFHGAKALEALSAHRLWMADCPRTHSRPAKPLSAFAGVTNSEEVVPSTCFSSSQELQDSLSSKSLETEFH